MVKHTQTICEIGTKRVNFFGEKIRIAMAQLTKASGLILVTGGH